MRLTLTALIAISSLAVSAGQTVISLTYGDGQTREVSIDETSKFTFSARYLIVYSDGKNQLFPLENLKKYTFRQEQTALPLTSADIETPFAINGDEATFAAADRARSVALCDLQGRVLLRHEIAGGQPVRLSIGHLSPGVYFMAVDGVNYKFAKR